MWTLGPSAVLPGYESLVSEKGAFDVPAESAAPCAVFWEYNAAENCSLAFSAEGYYESFRRPQPTLQIGLDGPNLSVIRDGQTNMHPPSQTTFDALVVLENCTVE